jgi:hypothetical protein
MQDGMEVLLPMAKWLMIWECKEVRIIAIGFAGSSPFTWKSMMICGGLLTLEA